MIVYSCFEIKSPKDLFESMKKRQQYFAEALVFYTEAEKRTMDCFLWHYFKLDGKDVIGSLTKDLPDMVDVSYGYNLKEVDLIRVQKFVQGEINPFLDDLRQVLKLPKLAKDVFPWCKDGRMFLTAPCPGLNKDLLAECPEVELMSRAEFWTFFDA